MSAADRLVYSTNPPPADTCPRCGQPPAQCRCEAPTPRGPLRAVLRIEKTGRGGKTVTVIDRLPADIPFLAALARRLRGACGAGGMQAVRGGVGRVEVQGDHRQRLRALLAAEGIAVKG